MDKRKIFKYLMFFVAGVVLTLAVVYVIFGGRKGAHGLEMEDVSLRDESADSCEDGLSEVSVENQGDGISQFGIPMDGYVVTDGTVRNGEYFSTLLSRLGVPQDKAYELTQCAGGIFDLKKIRVGNEYHAFYSREEDPRLDYLIYDIDRREYVMFTLKDTMKVEIFEREVKTVLNYAEVTISSSLWVDVKKAGASHLFL